MPAVMRIRNRLWRTRGEQTERRKEIVTGRGTGVEVGVETGVSGGEEIVKSEGVIGEGIGREIETGETGRGIEEKIEDTMRGKGERRGVVEVVVVAKMICL